VVETCVDCWAAELAFRGAPKAEDVVEYIDIRLLPAILLKLGTSAQVPA
jgi:hypothetical protein